MTIHTTHNSQTRVAESGKFKKQLTLTDLTFIGLGAIFGSGWLFAASHVASIAGPAGIASWVIGGFAVLLLGIVYCELGAALPRAGGIIRYPVFSHGELMGYLLGFITLIAFSSLISIEIVAARQYAAAWFPALTQPGSSSPTLLGWWCSSCCSVSSSRLTTTALRPSPDRTTSSACSSFWCRCWWW